MVGLNKNATIRLLFLVVLVILNIGLFRVLLNQHRQLIKPTAQYLEKISPALAQFLLGTNISEEAEAIVADKSLSVENITAGLNQERDSRKLHQLSLSTALNQAAEKVVTELLNKNGDFDAVNTDAIITNSLMKLKVSNISLYHDTVVGPETTNGLFNYWDTNTDHQTLISNPELTQVGIATGSVQLEGKNQGIVVAIFVKPQAVVTQRTMNKSSVSREKIVFPEISNQSILDALNLYRSDHKVHPLVEDARLCQYAEKRVKDLVAFGSLDEHAGFKKDFADPNNLPEPIKAYPGGAIGENLAYQFCRNMTTGDSFIAQTATALIEWCFDSSTKGHREAQLNSRYNAVCARHQDGYFVIIFGE